MHRPSCDSYPPGSPTTTRFTRTRPSDIVRPASSSQLAEVTDRARVIRGLQHLRAAAIAIEYERPRLAVTAHIDGGDFAERLEKAIERSHAARISEHSAASE